jgi:hypothetical protein
MNKFLLLIIIFLLQSKVLANDNDVVIAAFFGQGHTNENLSGWVGDEYDRILSGITSVNYNKFYLSHHNLIDESYDKIIAATNCNQVNEKKLIIIGSSWGSRNAHTLSKKYKKVCLKKASAFYYLDAVAKPTPWGFGQKPEAKYCKAFYQTHSWIRGKKARGCVNIKLNKRCEEELSNPKESNRCHIIAAIHTLENDIVDDINKHFR